MKAPPEDRWIPALLGWGAVAVGLGLRIQLALTDAGIYWPDEIHQSLEPAHRWIFGYGFVAWEFVEGARNWALPGLVGALFAAASALWPGSPAAYLTVTRLFFCALAGLTAWGTCRMAKAHGARPLYAAAGAAMFLLAAPVIYFAPRAMSETASAALVALGAALTLAPEASRSRGRFVLGVSLFGAAVLLRLHAALFCLVLLGTLAWRRDRRALVDAAVTLAVWAVLFGLLDKLTWGRWFHSALVYLQFNLVEGKASAWGTAPAFWYGKVLLKSMPPLFLLCAAASAAAWRRAPALVLGAWAFFLAHSAVPHKEYRFVFPMFPWLFAAAAVGLQAAEERWKRLPQGAPAYLALALAVLSASGLKALTFGDLGAYGPPRAKDSALDDFGDVNRLLLAASKLPDLCGLRVEPVHLAWTGGYAYLHRDVPFYGHNGPPRESGRYNYVVTLANSQGIPVARDGRFGLFRIGDACVKDEGFSYALP